MKNYVCQTKYKSGMILDFFYDNFSLALNECMNNSEESGIISSQVFDFAEDPDLKFPIIVAKVIK